VDARTVLAAEREHVLAQLAALQADFASIVEASRHSNADDEHDAEGATIAFERSQVDAHIRQANRHLASVDAALARVAEGTYGVCVVCRRPIPTGRLEARPTATTCVGCVG
jgi:DnaK suppressor protein